MTQRGYFLFGFLFTVASVGSGAFAQELESGPPKFSTLRIPAQLDTTDSIHYYIVQVLNQALKENETQYGKAILIQDIEATVQDRQLLNLEQGIIDIAWSVSNKLRDAHSQPIRIPVIGGLYGYRVLLIHQNQNSQIFPATIEALKSLTLVQDITWPDYAVLEQNGFKLEAAPYLAGFNLLKHQYVDAYPRGAHEVELELKNLVNRDLTIAPTVVLHYDNPLFFYVAKGNDTLAQRLTEGMHSLLESGYLNDSLQQQDFYQNALNIIRNRRVIFLSNNTMTPDSRVAARNLTPTLLKRVEATEFPLQPYRPKGQNSSKVDENL